MLTRLAKTLAVLVVAALSVSPLMGGCSSDGSDGVAGTTGTTGTPGTSPPIDTILDLSEDMPGFVLAIVGMSGGTGMNGNFQSGDTITVNFTIKTSLGNSLPINEVDGMAMWMSGPTSNYQHILPAGNSFYYTDMKTAAVQQADGSYTYTFPAVIPATYGPPYYDTTKFTDGELTGQALQAGTYTVAFRGYKNYTDVTGTSYRDVGWITKDFLFGSATAITSREVVKDANCNQCHVSIQFHGGTYRSTKLCVTCHTSGAEDRYSDTMGAGDTTPVTIDFRVMIHKIHNGAHLPSVVGVTTDGSGVRQYGTGTPYKVGGSGYAGSTIYDFSEIAFPVWPNMSYGMPRDVGYGGLTAGQKTQEDAILKGVTACDKCHGDPDGSGSQTAPTQGMLAYNEPSRRACGSCHDDVNWSATYSSNGFTMPVQANDSACATCHVGSNNTLDTQLAHKHPLFRKSYPAPMTFENLGVNMTLTSVVEPIGDGNGDDDGIVEPGEKMAITFTVKDDNGTNLDLSANTTASMSTLITGPTSNYNLLLYTSVPRGVITGAASYTINVPQAQFLEYVGVGTAAAGDIFVVSRGPIWTYTTTHPIYLHTVSAPGAGSTLASAAVIGQNYVDVADGAGSVFTRGDFVVIDNGFGGEEYHKVQRVQADFSGTTDRVWFGTPYQLSSIGTSAFSATLNSSSFGSWLRNAHTAGAAVNIVTLGPVAGGLTYTTDFTVAGSTITETATNLIGLGVKVVASYTGDFVVPSVYPTCINSSPDLDETWGKWQGKALIDGTYTASVWMGRTLYITPVGAAGVSGGDNTNVSTPSKGVKKDFLIGNTETTITAYGLISSGSNCESCHNELMFHGGGRRGFDACISCHGTAGMEDWPWYRASSSGTFPSVATVGVTPNFRTMLHKIHMGEGLWAGSSYIVLGNSASQHTYEEVVFPAWPGEAKHCDKCHGSSNTAWHEPADRTHPTAQTLPLRRWRPVCLACHDSPDAQGHYELNTSPSGYESCGACHDPNSVYAVKVVHKNR